MRGVLNSSMHHALAGDIYCNACGIYWKTHNRERPTDGNGGLLRAGSVKKVRLLCQGLFFAAPCTLPCSSHYLGLKVKKKCIVDMAAPIACSLQQGAVGTLHPI